MKIRLTTALAALAALPLALSSCTTREGIQATPEEARAIAREAYVYGFPLVDSYRIHYAYYVDSAGPEYRGVWNQVHSAARVYTPDDRAVQTPNSDTPYSMLGLDLRAEPLVITVPPIEGDRYFSVQLIDAYTHNLAYIGTRSTGNGGGSYLLAGPGWTGNVPDGIAEVFQVETALAGAIFRTQLFGPDDLENVRQIQAGYRAQPLSEFAGQPAPAAVPPLEFPTPLSVADQRTSLEFFNLLSFVLTFCPTHPSEQELMARFARIGVGSGKHLDVAALSPEIRAALEAGMADAWTELDEFTRTKAATGQVTAGDMFGTREFLQNNYLYRYAAAVLGIYGNSKAEAMYPVYRTDADGNALDGATSRYILRFAPGQVPPVNAFWSLTMYELPASLLVANPLNRYLINSPMLPGLRRDPDGGVTLYLQKDSPGRDRESNWLPAPSGPFMTVLRLYWPREEALSGAWKPPALTVVK